MGINTYKGAFQWMNGRQSNPNDEVTETVFTTPLRSASAGKHPRT